MKKPLKLWMLPQPWKALLYLAILPVVIIALVGRNLYDFGKAVVTDVCINLPRVYRRNIFKRSPRDATDEPP